MGTFALRQPMAIKQAQVPAGFLAVVRRVRTAWRERWRIASAAFDLKSKRSLSSQDALRRALAGPATNAQTAASSGPAEADKRVQTTSYGRYFFL